MVWRTQLDAWQLLNATAQFCKSTKLDFQEHVGHPHHGESALYILAWTALDPQSEAHPPETLLVTCPGHFCC